MPFLASCARILPESKIPSSISQLFHTNAVPSLMDELRIQQLLQDRKARLALFNDEIERARAEVSHLESQRGHVEHVIQQLEALISPVRRMPTDIMAKVFDHCISDQDPPTLDPRTAPLLLAQVCRSWRYLLFSLPCLWTSLQLDLPHGSSDWEMLVQSKSLAMHVWFSRSKALPISLVLSHPKGSLIQWHALMLLDKEILALACRLKQLSLRFSPRSLSSLFTFSRSPLPYLEHLDIQNTNSLPTSESPPPVVLHSAPKLRSLSLSWSTLDLRSFQIPWVQLQHLNLQYDASPLWNPVHTNYLPTLAQCPNLTTLFLGIGASIDEVDPAHIQPITLPRVHTFQCSIYLQSNYLTHFFDALHMPHLRHFSIRNVSLALGSFTGQSECLPFIIRCADTLDSVQFSRLDIADPAVLSCLGHLQRLKTLSFIPGVLRLNHGLITALTLTHDTQGICPALEVLRLRCSSVIPVDAITRLIVSRCRLSAVLPTLKQFSLQIATFEYGLDMRDRMIDQVRTELGPCVEDGLDLQLTKVSGSG